MKKTSLTFLAVVCSSLAFAKDALSTKQTPLSFIENKGQVTDQKFNSRADIQFKITAAAGLNIFIGDGAIHYQFCKRSNTPANTNQPRKRPFTSEPWANSASVYYLMCRLDVELVGANKNAQVVTEERQNYYENYFTTNVGIQGATANAYNRITYKNIYPNIDWVLYINNGQLEHEFIVNEGGNAAEIQLKYGGATALQVNTDGSLTATTAQGTITEQPPTSYDENGNVVKSNFKLNGDLLTYEVGSCSGKLVIDPVLEWGTYYGEGGFDAAYGVTTDNAGNVYITGQTWSAFDVATTGAYQDTLHSYLDTLPGNGVDAFLAKFNSAGVLLWATYYGGNGEDAGTKVTTDNAENVFITGVTSSTSDIATPGAYQTIAGGLGEADAFLAKFNSAGAIQWSTFFGGSGYDDARGIATDAAGNVYITGLTSSTAGIATPGSYQPVIAGSGSGSAGDAFLAKFNGAGMILWATYFGGPEEDNAFGLAADNSGNVYITGTTGSASGIATAGAFETVYGGTSDAFLAKFNSAGSIQWSTYYGGSEDDGGNGVATDRYGNIYITGYSGSISGIATPGAYQTVEQDAGLRYDAFLTKFNSSGSVQWATYLGGPGNDNSESVATDSLGNVYITGWTNSRSGIATLGAFNTIMDTADILNAFLTTFSSTGNMRWSTYYGGSDIDEAYGVATDHNENIYITGGATSSTGIATLGAHESVLIDGSGISPFLAKFNGASITRVNNIPTPILDIAIYPNPAQNALAVSSSSPITTIAITNLLGQIVYNQEYYTTQAQVNISTLPAGIYFIKVNESITKKFVKQ